MVRGLMATRHGATQPESKRANKQLLLRLPPEDIDQLRELARELGVTMSQAVSLMLLARHVIRVPAE